MTGSSKSDIVDALRLDIVTNRFEPGSRLPILELQDRFGVGLTALHKAFAQLAVDGLVTAESPRGVRTAPVSGADLRDLTQARLAIEPLAIRDAVNNATDESDARMVAALHMLSRTAPFADPETMVYNELYLARHRILHEALTATCTSSWLRRFRAILFVHAERYQQISVVYRNRQDLRRDHDTKTEHAALVDAVLARDEDLAAALMTNHVASAAQLLLEHHFKKA